ncbi:MAG: hypothetical protein H6874_13080 [Hyphomicrobiaceae bacterium]|nr:hypothetical protein [Hyphomicrobiaceae bacterium]
MRSNPKLERAKATAQLLNGIAVSLISFGIVVPLLTKLPVSVSLVMALLGAGALHFVARGFSGKMVNRFQDPQPKCDRCKSHGFNCDLRD